ncbi:MAG: zinc ribbon domain-containing protein [[Eubacterium] siraeum]
MTNSRTGITVTTIITAVITFFELTGVVALGVMNGIFGGDAFRQMLYDAIASGELDFEDFATANEAMNFALSVVNAVFIVSIIVCILVAAFGIFATVIGFKTMADKTLTAAAAANTAARNQAYNMPGYNSCNTSFRNGYYNYGNPQQELSDLCTEQHRSGNSADKQRFSKQRVVLRMRKQKFCRTEILFKLRCGKSRQ